MSKSTWYFFAALGIKIKGSSCPGVAQLIVPREISSCREGERHPSIHKIVVGGVMTSFPS